ncbi:hypothetical protein P692DRAFT_20556665 [Suillus brevipes Sb2]|nr:hypothetical protein P692DRAFT_20556665 [Suillus brevipes Sb2]
MLSMALAVMAEACGKFRNHTPSAAALAIGAWKSQLAMGFNCTRKRACIAHWAFDFMVIKAICDIPLFTVNVHGELISMNDMDVLTLGHLGGKSISPWILNIQYWWPGT